MTIFKRNKKPSKPKTIKPEKAEPENQDQRIKELEAALEQEKLQHKTAREEFAKEIAIFNKGGELDCAAKDALIDEFIVEVMKLLPSSDLVRRAREHRGTL